jgi:anti-anti-sigma regulatory factor
MIETINRAFERSGHRLTIVNPSRSIRREVERLDLDRVLRIETETPVAVAATA